MKKDYNLHIRISKEQLAYLMEQSGKYGINYSVYVRRLLDKERGNTAPEQTQKEYLQRKELIYEINRIGNNINQIVKNANMHYYSEMEKKKLFAMMTKLISMIEREEENGSNRNK